MLNVSANDFEMKMKIFLRDNAFSHLNLEWLSFFSYILLLPFDYVKLSIFKKAKSSSQKAQTRSIDCHFYLSWSLGLEIPLGSSFVTENHLDLITQ